LDDLAEAKKLHSTRFTVVNDTPLGSGSFGVVQKVKYTNKSRTICLARKVVRPPNRRFPMQLLREEANVMEKLDHEHIVKLVGTYCIRTDFYLLLWPVAVCNLDSLLNDIDCLKTGQGDHDDTVARLHALDLNDLSAIAQTHSAAHASSTGNCPLKYLQQIMGCITRAVAYCHQANIRHLDLKPSNILLNPGSVYLADFGISKDVHDREHTMTRGQMGTPKWRAPELHQNQDDWSMKAADVYSLGMVLVNIATVIYGAPLDDFDAMLGDLSARSRAEKLHAYLRKLEGVALATQDVEDVNAPTFAPKHVVNLASRMVSSTPSSRPVIFQVDSELVELGGIDQVYHSSCCKKSSRFVTDRMNTKFKLVVDERNRLRAVHDQMATRLEVLEAKDDTYELRLSNERKAQAEKVANLQAQLEKERNERKRLEALIAEQQQKHHGRQHRPSIPRPASDRQAHGNSSSAAGLMMRERPRTHPLPSRPSQPVSQPAQIQQQSPAFAAHSPRPSYSQTAAAAVTPLTLSAIAMRRDSLLRTSPLPSPGPVSTGSPTPDTVGYPLRSRTSGSRLPRAINPATPIRANTPIVNRDPSSTDSTQYSMSSSVFSRMSLSKHSVAETSVAGTPPINTHSPAMITLSKESSSTSAADVKETASPTEAYPYNAHFGGGVGLGLGISDRERRESVTSGPDSMRDTASVISSVGFGTATLSPIMSGSALSSPRAAYATMEGGGRVPPLPTGQSWADVARRERRG
jgi:serine/threonine protein kinase